VVPLESLLGGAFERQNLEVCLGKSTQEALLGGVYLANLLQCRLKSGRLATADCVIMQVG